MHLTYYTYYTHIHVYTYTRLLELTLDILRFFRTSKVEHKDSNFEFVSSLGLVTDI